MAALTSWYYRYVQMKMLRALVPLKYAALYGYNVRIPVPFIENRADWPNPFWKSITMATGYGGEAQYLPWILTYLTMDEGKKKVNPALNDALGKVARLWLTDIAQLGDLQA